MNIWIMETKVCEFGSAWQWKASGFSYVPWLESPTKFISYEDDHQVTNDHAVLVTIPGPEWSN